LKVSPTTAVGIPQNDDATLVRLDAEDVAVRRDSHGPWAVKAEREHLSPEPVRHL
jgi:hypothetical protein